MSHTITGTLRKATFIKSGVGQNGESTMFGLELSEMIKDKQGNVLGQMVKCKTIKNNVKRPFIEVKVPLYYGFGIDRSLDLLQLARDLTIVDYKSGWYSYNEHRFREADLVELIKTDEEFRSRAETASMAICLAALKASGVDVPSSHHQS